MGRRPCCEKERVNRGAWTAIEDKLLTDHIKLHGEGRWRSLPKIAGLKRCGKSCRLRWLNYLRPEIKRGNITADEEDLIIRLHNLLGNRWSLIAGRLPGRTDNEIKNYWNTNLSKKIGQDDHRRSILKIKNSCYKKRSITESPNPDPSSVVVRAKAVKCTRVFIAQPPPPPEPPLSLPSSTQMKEIENSLDFGEGLMDLPEMDFSLSFSEFFDSEKLASDICCNELSLEDAGEQFSSPEDPFDDGVFSEEMMGDWRRSSCALDANMLANWLGV